ncbi:MAG: alcohol dehydrogenase [Bacteroidetes bacterium SW_9_63_38]|nr:MAG: alcohol dehydrogenase [Bacteroidetes bacterium SW_9_63_38]
MDIAIVGCGDVAGQYAPAIAAHNALRVSAVADLDADRTEALGRTHDVPSYTTLSDLLSNESVGLVLNLTSHAAHAEVTQTAIEAGVGVYSEKPLALDAAEAQALVEAADDRGVVLGCAPYPIEGDAQKLTWRLLADGRLGTVRWGYATTHIGRLTEWHDNPESILQVGALYDGAVYPLSVLTAYFGPVTHVEAAHDARLEADPGDDWAPDQTVAVLAFADGSRIQLSASTYVPHQTKQFNTLELHGDDGSLFLENTGETEAPADPAVEFARLGTGYTPVRQQADPSPVGRAAPVAALAAAARGERPVPDSLDPRRAAHVVAVLEAIEACADGAGPVSVDGPSFSSPATPPTVPAPADRLSSMPPIGFGCSRFRDGTYVDLTSSIETALDAGCRLLDMAELYGNEAEIGDLLDAPGRPDRDALYLVSKVWNTNHAPKHLRAAFDATLDRLGVDRLDCYMLHWPDAWAHRGPLGELKDRPTDEAEALTFPTDEEGDIIEADVPLSDSWAAMESLVEEGRTTHLGVSNVGRPELRELLSLADIPPAIVQIERHPYLPQSDLVAFCREHDIAVMAHSPLSAEGLLTEPVLHEIAENHEIAPAQVVLRWNVERGVVPIPSSTTPSHVIENLDVFRFALSEADLQRIDELADPECEPR